MNADKLNARERGEYQFGPSAPVWHVEQREKRLKFAPTPARLAIEHQEALSEQAAKAAATSAPRTKKQIKNAAKQAAFQAAQAATKKRRPAVRRKRVAK